MSQVNFIEKDNVAEANQVDLTVYRWSERMSAMKGKYVFVLRQIKKSGDD
jgi:hypothetical protein